MNNNRSEDIVYLSCRLRVIHCRSAYCAAKTPARTIETDESDKSMSCGSTAVVDQGQLGNQLSAERAVTLFDFATLGANVLRDCAANLLPEAFASRRSKCHELQL